MQLLDTLSLPTAQFASLSILLQLHHEDFSPTQTTRSRSNGHSIDGKEKQTDNAHLSSSPSGNAADRNATPMTHSVLKHDLITISPCCLLHRDVTERALGSLHTKVMMERGMRDDVCGIHAHRDEHCQVVTEQVVSEDETQDDSNKQARKGVSFHEDTKAGKEVGQITPEGEQTSNNNGILPVKIYRPPSNQTLCSLGFHLHYVQINVDDIGDDSDDATMFKRVISVLLPDMSLTSLTFGIEKQSAVILLTVAVTGPAYDIYGSSSLITNLPNRLREGMAILSAVDTTSKNEDVQSPIKEKIENTKSNKLSGISHFAKNEGMGQSAKKSTLMYDSTYFHRLYMALLATILDDEDRLLRDHDAAILNASNAYHLTAQNRLNDTPKSKNKRFIFPRKGGNKTLKYESRDTIEEDVIHLEAEAHLNKTANMSSNAEIARQNVLQMEILSVAEDDMPLPKYQHAIEGKRQHQIKSPRSGGGMVTIASGQFGRKENQYDLAGFDYRPAFGPGSVSNTVSTAGSSDDVSTATGDDTTAMSSKYTAFSNASSVPTLSKSKKDSAGKSSRFKFLQKRKETNATKSPSKPPLPLPKHAPRQEIFDPFSYDGDVIHEEQEDRMDTSNSIASESTKETSDQSVQQLINAAMRSYSEDESEGARSLPDTGNEEKGVISESIETEKDAIPMRCLVVDLALNEDLTCEYKQSKLSSINIEGTVQVRVHNQEEQQSEKNQPPIPFLLVFQDHSHHIKSIQENKKYVEYVDLQSEKQEYISFITVPRENEYFPVVRYKCSKALRPVPIRVQSRIRTEGKLCRVALQISSNPQNHSDLVHLTVIMGVPKDVVNGNSFQSNPSGGTYNEQKSLVLWCVSELGSGEKFQLQATFELEDRYLNAENDEDLASKLDFPVLARCQCSGAQLSDIVLDVRDIADHFPADIARTVVRRFRVSHKEK